MTLYIFFTSTLLIRRSLKLSFPKYPHLFRKPVLLFGSAKKEEKKTALAQTFNLIFRSIIFKRAGRWVGILGEMANQPFPFSWNGCGQIGWLLCSKWIEAGKGREKNRKAALTNLEQEHLSRILSSLASLVTCLSVCCARGKMSLSNPLLSKEQFPLNACIHTIHAEHSKGLYAFKPPIYTLMIQMELHAIINATSSSSRISQNLWNGLLFCHFW